MYNNNVNLPQTDVNVADCGDHVQAVFITLCNRFSNLLIMKVIPERRRAHKLVI